MLIDFDIFSVVKQDVKKTHFFKGASSKNILTWKEIETYLNNYVNLHDSNVNIIDDEKIVKGINFPWSKVTCVDPEFLFEKINKGHGFVIHNFSRSSEKINFLCESIEKYFRQTVTDVHVYAGTKTTSESFPSHWDFVDNFILQQDGQTEWTIYKEFASENNIEKNNQISQFEESMNVDMKIILHPGDVLYIPSFRYHKAVPLEKRISLSIPVPLEQLESNRIWYKIN